MSSIKENQCRESISIMRAEHARRKLDLAPAATHSPFHPTPPRPARTHRRPPPSATTHPHTLGSPSRKVTNRPLRSVARALIYYSTSFPTVVSDLATVFPVAGALEGKTGPVTRNHITRSRRGCWSSQYSRAGLPTWIFMPALQQVANDFPLPPIRCLSLPSDLTYFTLVPL